MKKLLTYFLQGLLFIAPLGLTVYFVYRIFMFTDGLLYAYLEEHFDIKTPGLGILIIFIFLVVLGIVGESIVARPFNKLFTRILEKTPFLKLIYSSINDLFSAFLGKERKFHHPVMIRLDNSNNVWKMGFITQERPLIVDEQELLTVYCPFSYGLSGEIFFVPAANVRSLSMPAPEAMKYIISGGVSGPDLHPKVK